MFTLIYAFLYAFIQSFQFNMEAPILLSLTAFCLIFQLSYLSFIYLSLQYSLCFLSEVAVWQIERRINALGSLCGRAVLIANIQKHHPSGEVG